jgi:hypothetical protein
MTRETLHRVAAHVLGRRRHDVTGRFGLRPTPGGFATPAFGDGPETLRVAGPVVVREEGAGAACLPIAGSTLRALAEFAETDIDRPFEVGADTPPAGDVDAPLVLDHDATIVIADWFALGARALDEVVAALPAGATPAVVQLWPEHFDVATHVAVGDGERVNLGASPGDTFSDEPYLYVAPWGDVRPGDGEFWNAPFGAVLPRRDVVGAADPVAAAVRFLRGGIGRF